MIWSATGFTCIQRQRWMCANAYVTYLGALDSGMLWYQRAATVLHGELRAGIMKRHNSMSL
jgi:hypothetical protein